MQDLIPEWLLNSLSTTVILGAIGYLFRETLVKFFTKSVEHRFDTKLAEAKAEFRAKEQELDHIMDFLSAQKRERNSVIQAKRIEAAETVLRICDTMSQLSMALETMKSLNIEEISKEAGTQNIKRFFETILDIVKPDDKFAIINKIDQTGPKLYLNQHTMDCFNTYTAIMMYPIIFMNFMSISTKGADYMKPGHLRTKVEKLVPASKKGFDEHGERYAFYWGQYFYDETLKALRSATNGEEQDKADATAIGELSVTSQMKQIEVRQKISELELAEKFFVKEPDVPELPASAD